MKKNTSELIKMLQDLQTKFGDLPIYVWDDFGMPVAGFNIKHEPQDDTDPERIELWSSREDAG